MGVPKQKWTAEEEAALKAGLAKYGAGKWSTILKDPQFSIVLHMRSNVDLKDKWRNMNVMASGNGSRQKARPAIKNTHPILVHDDNSISLSTVVEGNIEVADAMPLAKASGQLSNVGSKKPLLRLEDHILEAITNLKEPHGSNRTAIAIYIEGKYLASPNLERLLAANLKFLSDNGKLIKVKHQYRIAPSSPLFDVKKSPSSSLLVGKEDSPRAELNDTNIFDKVRIDEELEKMKSMTVQEAEAAAARAVADAEAAIAEAEEAVKEAEDAEREAEAAKVFAEAAMKALKCRTRST